LIPLENFQLDMKGIKALLMPGMHLELKVEGHHRLLLGTREMSSNKG
jgi:hypothetical protein